MQQPALKKRENKHYGYINILFWQIPALLHMVNVFIVTKHRFLAFYYRRLNLRTFYYLVLLQGRGGER